MEYKFVTLDIDRNLESKQRAVYKFSRPKLYVGPSSPMRPSHVRPNNPAHGTFWICRSPLIAPAEKIQFSFCQQEEDVLVPLFPYYTPENVDPAYIVVHCLQAGMLAIEALKRYTPAVPLVCTIVTAAKIYDQRPQHASWLYSFGTCFQVQD